MGYYASASGSFVIAGLSHKEISDMLNKLTDEISEFVVTDRTVDNNGKVITEFSYSSSHFDGDYLTETLGNIFGDYIVEGEINCESHEDTSVWRYIFNADDQTWNEEDARTVYDLKSFSDDELISELTERGYTVMREAKLRDIIG